MGGYFHSVILDETMCNGCTHCLRRCPTEAIRVRDRKASIFPGKCIDCGECIRVCPYHAQKAVNDALEDINHYKYKIAIVPSVVHAQFDATVDIQKILKAVEMLGFDRVYDISPYSDIVSSIIKYYLENDLMDKPIISNNCPAIVRLIQLKYPGLIKNILPIVPPMEMAARLIKKQVVKEKNYRPFDVGIFYITPCPAKVTSIRAPLGVDFSYTDKAISFRSIYTAICRNLKKIQDAGTNGEYSYSGRGIGIGRIGGQSYSIDFNRYLAVDGIENVIRILDELELGNLRDVGFIEACGCVGGCVGGPLLVENNFIAKTRIRYLSENLDSPPLLSRNQTEELLKTHPVKMMKEIRPKKLMSLDSNIKEAIRKMEKIEDIMKKLPNIDCGSCGAPTCRALAEDIVNGIARMEDCAFRIK